VVDDWYWCGVMWGGATDSVWIEEGEVGRVCRRRIVEGAWCVCISRLVVFRVAVSCRCKSGGSWSVGSKACCSALAHHSLRVGVGVSHDARLTRVTEIFSQAWHYRWTHLLGTASRATWKCQAPGSWPEAVGAFYTCFDDLYCHHRRHGAAH
jgi:hypothetical protein